MPRRPHVQAAVLALLFVALASWQIERPGLQYDEALFINAATGARGDPDFVYARLGRVPLLLMPYLGALKAGLYAPLFSVLGASVETVRLPVIGLSALTVALYFLCLRTMVAPALAFAGALALVLDPAFLFTTRLDWGPVALMMLLKLGALYALTPVLGPQSSRALGLFVACILLGVYDKLNFVWFALACIAAAVLVFPGRVRALCVPLRARTAVPIAILFAGLFLFAVFLIDPILDLDAAPATSLRTRTMRVLQLFRETFDGSYVYAMLFGTEPSSTSIAPTVFWAAAVVGVCKLPRALATDRPPEIAATARWFAFYLTTCLLIIAQIAATRQAIGPHHLMVLSPLPLTVVVLFLHAVRLTAKPLGSALAVLVMGGIVLTGGRTVAEYHARLATPATRNPFWSEAIDDLSRTIEASGSSCIVIATWGLGTQLKALAARGHRRHYRDVWTWFADYDRGSTESAGLIEQTLASQPCLLVSFAPAAGFSPPGADGTAKFIARHAATVAATEVIRDAAGIPRYEIRTMALPAIAPHV
jgi:hypothetical protein